MRVGAFRTAEDREESATLERVSRSVSGCGMASSTPGSYHLGWEITSAMRCDLAL